MQKNTYNPRISVVVPVYNTEKYLQKCIASIQNQTYQNLEIICVDDGSIDSSGIILDDMEKEDNRLHIIHTKNKGVSEARNIALEYSSGEIISFIDSDDYIEPDMFNFMIQGMKNPDVDIVACNYSMVYGEEIFKMLNKQNVPQTPMNAIEFLQYIYERDLYKGVAGYVCTRLFRKDLIIGNNCKKEIVKFNNNLSLGEDVVFLAEVNMRAKQVLYIDKALYNYVQHVDSAVHNQEKQLEKLDWIYAYNQIINIYEKNNVPEKIIDLVKRMYVYRCGKILEIAFEKGRKDRIILLKSYIKANLDTYVKTNIDYLDRVQWIVELLQREL